MRPRKGCQVIFCSVKRQITGWAASTADGAEEAVVTLAGLK
jgi:hypothetical protein